MSKDTGAEVELSRPSGSETYTLGGRSGASILSFNLAQAGAYELSADYPAGQGGPQVVLAVAHGFAGGLIAQVLGFFAIDGAFTILALAIAGWTYFARRKAIAALRADAT